MDARIAFNAKIRIRTLSNYDRVRRTEDEFWENAQRIAHNLETVRLRDDGVAEWEAERSDESAEKFIALIKGFDEDLENMRRLGEELEDAVKKPRSPQPESNDIEGIAELARQISATHNYERLAAAQRAKDSVNKLLRFVPLKKLLFRCVPIAFHTVVGFGVLSFALDLWFDTMEQYVHPGVYIGLVALCWAVIEYVIGPWLDNWCFSRRVSGLHKTANRIINELELALMNVYANAVPTRNRRESSTGISQDA